MIQPDQYIRNLLQRQPGERVIARGLGQDPPRQQGRPLHPAQRRLLPGDLQVVLDAGVVPRRSSLRITTGACIRVEGDSSPPRAGPVRRAEGARRHVYGAADPPTYPLQKKGHTMEFLREIAHLRPRSNTFGAVFRVRNALPPPSTDSSRSAASSTSTRRSSPARLPRARAPCSSVTTLDLMNLPRTERRIDFAEDFFGKPAFLTVSGQLEAEIFALAFANVYTFGPTFRAENSQHARATSPSSG